ncbi:hypothetical protein BDV19DRAFT_368154 [Aspergillus venezuelensis]
MSCSRGRVILRALHVGAVVVPMHISCVRGRTTNIVLSFWFRASWRIAREGKIVGDREGTSPGIEPGRDGVWTPPRDAKSGTW